MGERVIGIGAYSSAIFFFCGKFPWRFSVLSPGSPATPTPKGGQYLFISAKMAYPTTPSMYDYIEK